LVTKYKYMKKDCFILGTRPTIIKLAPIIKKTNAFVIHTGQHKELADNMYKLFNIKPDIDLKMMKKNQDISEFLSECIYKLNKIVKKNKFERIWVHGDTMSCLAGAIVASMNKITLIHNESGLRSYDKNNPFPEETTRILIDNMADILFAPTKRAVKNLKKENIKGKIYMVGNTVVDALEMFKKKLPKKRPIEEKYILATIHRRESFGNDIIEIFKALKELSKTTKVILPVHPNPNVQKAIKEIGLETIKPIDYKTFLWYLRDCEYVCSDSGGIQEEVPSFNKKIIVLRKTTERPETIESGYGILVNKLEKQHILKTINKFIKIKTPNKKNPFGNGDSSKKILKIIKKNV